MIYRDFINTISIVNGKPQFAHPAFNSYYNRLFKVQKIVDPITQILSAVIHYGTHKAAQRQSITSAEKYSLHIGLPIPGAHAFSLLNLESDWTATVLDERFDIERENAVLKMTLDREKSSGYLKKIVNYTPDANIDREFHKWSAVTIGLHGNERSLCQILDQELDHIYSSAAILLFCLPGGSKYLQSALESHGYSLQLKTSLFSLEILILHNTTHKNVWENFLETFNQ